LELKAFTFAEEIPNLFPSLYLHLSLHPDVMTTAAPLLYFSGAGR
jgi:hypothetical protein